jgi:hypothetical protein
MSSRCGPHSPGGRIIHDAARSHTIWASFAYNKRLNLKITAQPNCCYFYVSTYSCYYWTPQCRQIDARQPFSQHPRRDRPRRTRNHARSHLQTSILGRSGISSRRHRRSSIRRRDRISAFNSRTSNGGPGRSQRSHFRSRRTNRPHRRRRIDRILAETAKSPRHSRRQQMRIGKQQDSPKQPTFGNWDWENLTLFPAFTATAPANC